MEDKHERMDAYDMFGVSKEQSEGLCKHMLHVKIDSEDIPRMAVMLGMKELGVDGLKAFLFGKFVACNDMRGGLHG